MHGTNHFTDIAIVLAVAAVTGWIAHRLRQPTILGYLFAGILVGPYLPVPIIAKVERIEALAELGVVLVMFTVGLELRLRTLRHVLPISGVTALVQISFLMWCGFTLGWALGWSTVASLFLGACLCISSTMVVTRVFEGVRPDLDVRTHVLGVLVLQDVVAIALITALTGVAASGQVAASEVLKTMALLLAVVVGTLAFGLVAVPRMVRNVIGRDSTEVQTVVSIGLCFGVALLVRELGFSVALGAFLAGVVVSESGHGRHIEHLISSTRDMFVAIFFVSIGMTVDPRTVLEHLPLSLGVVVVIIVAHLLSVFLGGVLSGIGVRRSLTSGLALGQIGEFSFILALIGISAGVVGTELRPVLVTAAVVTAFTTPQLLRRAPAVVGFVDRHLPSRLRRALGLYEQWVMRSRSLTHPPEQHGHVRRALRALAIDVAAFILTLALAIVWIPRVSQAIAPTLGLGVDVTRVLLVAALLVVLAPLLLGAFRNARLLARTLGDTLVQNADSEGQRAARAVFRGFLFLGILVAVGAPIVAVLRPLINGPYGAITLATAMIIGVVVVSRRVRDLDAQFLTGAEHIANMLTRSTAADDEEAPVDDEALLPGLDHVVSVRLSPGAFAVGRTLAVVNLRARTDATVVALYRGGDERRILPTGIEQLRAGDVLAVAGTERALTRALRLLREGSLPEDEPVGP